MKKESDLLFSGEFPFLEDDIFKNLDDEMSFFSNNITNDQNNNQTNQNNPSINNIPNLNQINNQNNFNNQLFNQNNQTNNNNNLFNSTPKTPNSPVNFNNQNRTYNPIIMMPKSFPDKPLQANQTSSQQSMNILNNVHQYAISLPNLIRSIQTSIIELNNHPSQQLFQNLVGILQDTMKKVSDAVVAIEKIYSENIFNYFEVLRHRHLCVYLNGVKVQLNLYGLEVQQLSKPLNERNYGICGLVIIEEPLPKCYIKKKRYIEDPITVQLITGATTVVTDISEVTCSLFTTQEMDLPITNKNLEHNKSIMKENRCCNFSVLFSKGSRKQSIKVYFSVKVQVQHSQGQQIFTVNSAPSDYFIIMTNDIQWADAEGQLLSDVFFNKLKSVSFHTMANTLQTRFLMATKQEFDDVKRPLSFVELKYIFDRYFGGQNSIQSENWNNFWQWFGPCFQKIRFTRHLSSFWCLGILIGFISKKDLEQILLGNPVGSFMLRFSERNSGSLVIGYNSGDLQNPIHHCILTEENSGKNLSKIADFIGENSGLTHFCRLVPKTHNQDPQTSKPSFDLVQKHHALENFYSKVPSRTTNIEGYDTTIVRPQILDTNYPFNMMNQYITKDVE